MVRDSDRDVCNLLSDDIYKFALDNIPDNFGIFCSIRDETGKIIDFDIKYLNKAACNNNRGIRNDCIGKTLLEIFPSHGEDDLFTEYCHVVETGVPLIKECLGYDKAESGTYEKKVYDLKAVKAGDGFAAIWRDITVLKGMEHELRRYAAIVESSGDAILGKTLDGVIISWNKSAERIYGYTAGEIIGKSLKMLASSEKYEEIDEILEKVGKGECISHHETVRKRKDGRLIEVSITVSPIFDVKGNVLGASTIARDIRGTKKIQEELLESEEKFRSAFENAAIGMVIVSVDGCLIKANRSFCSIVGYTKEELAEKTITDLTHPDDLDKDNKYSSLLMKGKIPFYHMEKRYIHKSGHVVWVMVSRSLIHDKKGKPLYFIGQVQDITKRKQAEDELRNAKLEAERARERAELLANTDYLTGLLNRRAFMERLKEEYDKMKREGTDLSLILADIDHFKNINDTYGHNIGDLVLQEFSQCLSKLCRTYDFIGRHGGEEFIICLPNTNSKQAEDIAERMRKAVECLSIKIPEGMDKITITSSFGIASTQSLMKDSLDYLIGQADMAMYKAKVGGRNMVCLGRSN